MYNMRYFLWGLVLVGLISCSTDDSDSLVGEDFVQSTTKVYFIDSLTVDASTIVFDSLTVTSPDRLLVGSYNDEVFGQTYAKTYIQLSDNTSDIDDDAVYDSIAIIFKYDNYFYNDTVVQQQFNVYKLTEDMEPDDDDDEYYNTTDFSYDPTPIATQNFYPRIYKDDSLELKMNDSFGEHLFNDIRDNDINDVSDDFVDEYKGFLVEANSDISSSVLGFSTDSYLRIYYSVEDGDGELQDETMDFSFNLTNTFSSIGSDKTGTYFENVTTQETNLSSEDTGNATYIQAGTGIATRIDIPYLETLYDLSPEGEVVSAELKVYLRHNSYSDNLSVRDSLAGYIVDNDADIVGYLVDDDGEEIYSTTVSSNSEFDTDEYVIDVTNFIEIKREETSEKYYLVLYPQDFNSSVDRYIFSDDPSDDLEIKLELTYASYE